MIGITCLHRCEHSRARARRCRACGVVAGVNRLERAQSASGYRLSDGGALRFALVRRSAYEDTERWDFEGREATTCLPASSFAEHSRPFLSRRHDGPLWRIRSSPGRDVLAAVARVAASWRVRVSPRARCAAATQSIGTTRTPGPVGRARGAGFGRSSVRHIAGSGSPPAGRRTDLGQRALSAGREQACGRARRRRLGVRLAAEASTRTSAAALLQDVHTASQHILFSGGGTGYEGRLDDRHS